jgi:allantoinase
MADPARIPPVGEVRRPGLDHDLYPFRTGPETPRIAWPGGARMAFTVTLALDAWELAPPPDASRDPRMVSSQGSYFPDWLSWSQREYGARVGVFRILALLDRFGVAPSVALGSGAIRRYPELVDECARRGAAFMAHGSFATRRITSRMSEAEERDFITESRDAVTRATGAAPRGWCGQDFNESDRTPALLAECGFAYVADWSNDDRPYRIGPGGLVSLPAHSEWNDLEAMWLRQVPPDIWAAGVGEAAEVLHGEGGAAFNLTLHPFVTGQAHRIRYLEAALSLVLGLPGLFATTTDAVADASG